MVPVASSPRKWIWSTKSITLLIFVSPFVLEADDRQSVLRVRVVCNRVRPLRGVLDDACERLRQRRDVAVYRLTCGRVIRERDGRCGFCSVPVDPHVDPTV